MWIPIIWHIPLPDVCVLFRASYHPSRTTNIQQDVRINGKVIPPANVLRRRIEEAQLFGTLYPSVRQSALVIPAFPL